MHILLVHGLGRTPLSFVALSAALRRHGHTPHLFGYVAAVESWQRILRRLRMRLYRLAEADSEYALVGHSLGGVLIATALSEPWPSDLARPLQVITLGTPVRPPRLARTASRYAPFELFTGEAGRKLCEVRTYDALESPRFTWTAIYGTAGPRLRVFGNAPNDGLVAASETQTDAADCFEVTALHTFLPSHARSRALVLHALARSLSAVG